jgi:hypothetical protein
MVAAGLSMWLEFFEQGCQKLTRLTQTDEKKPAVRRASKSKENLK